MARLIGSGESLVWTLAIGCAAGLSSIAPGQTGPSDDPVEIARQFAADLTEGRYAEAAARFDEAAAKALPAETLEEVWQSVLAQVGAFQSLGDPRVSSEGGLTIVVFPAACAKVALNLRIGVNAEGRISQFLIQPAAGAEPTTAYERPSCGRPN